MRRGHQPEACFRRCHRRKRKRYHDHAQRWHRGRRLATDAFTDQDKIAFANSGINMDFTRDLTDACDRLYPESARIYKTFFSTDPIELPFEGNYLSAEMCKKYVAEGYFKAVDSAVRALHNQQHLTRELQGALATLGLHSVKHGWPKEAAREEVARVYEDADPAEFERYAQDLRKANEGPNSAFDLRDYIQSEGLKSFLIMNWTRGLWLMDNRAIEFAYKRFRRQDATESMIKKTISTLSLARICRESLPIYLNDNGLISVKIYYLNLFVEIRYPLPPASP